MSFKRPTVMAEAFAKAALKSPSLNRNDPHQWVARSVADKMIHADRHYSVVEFDRRPSQQSKEQK